MLVDLQTHSDTIFLPLYYDLAEATTRYVLNYGGSGSGKSYSQHQLELTNLLDDPEYDTLIIRKHASDIYDSSYKLLRNIAQEWGVYGLLGWAFSNQKRQITHPNGRAITFRGLDDPEKIKSIAGIKRIVVEEASQLEQEDFEELMRRARGIEGIQIILLFNPIDENHWIKKTFFDSDLFEDGVDFVWFKTTYLDNPYTTDEDLKQFEIMKRMNYAKYRVYALAEWGRLENKNPWLRTFDLNKHVAEKPLQIVKHLPINLSFDFNIDPMTCIVEQHTKYYGPGSFMHVLKEFEIANCTVKEMCAAVKAEFPFSVITVTGDATGRNRNAGYTTGKDNIWMQIQKELKLSASQVLTPGSNPSHTNNRYLCNYLFQEHDNVLIDPSCKKLIDECVSARPIETENQDKEDTLFKGAGSGKYGYNLFDCLRYCINTHHQGILKK